MMRDLEKWAARGRWLVNKMTERTTPDGRTVLEISEVPIWAKQDGTFDQYVQAVDSAMEAEGEFHEHFWARGLTDEQIMDLPAGKNDGSLSYLLRFARAVERAHGIDDA